MQITKIVVLIINVYQYTSGNLNLRFFFALSRKCETTKQKAIQLLSHLSEILTGLQPATCNLQFTPSVKK